jgi:hypothetical protein
MSVRWSESISGGNCIRSRAVGERRWPFVGLLVAVSAAPVAAAPTGLNTIPTADLIPFHQWTGTVQNGNTSLSQSPIFLQQPLVLYQTQFGLTPRLEGGLDFVPAQSIRDYQPSVNFKWKALTETYNRPALAVGTSTLGPHFDPSAYLVVTRTLNFSQVQYNKFKAHQRNIKLRGRRIHAGFLHSGTGNFPFVGADWELSDNWVVYTDWISGDANAVTLGGVYTINSKSSITSYFAVGNQKQELNGFSINYSRTFKW